MLGKIGHGQIEVEMEDISDWLECGSVMDLGDGRLLIGCGERLWLDNHTQRTHCFYFPDFFLKLERPWFVQEQSEIFSSRELLDWLSQQNLSAAPPLQWFNTSQSLFFDSFQILQTKFASGELLKAVPFACQIANQTMVQEQLQQSLLSSLKYIQKGRGYLYGFWDFRPSHPRSGILGITPEILFHKKADGDIETMACAGTKPKTMSSPSFLTDPKQLQEHAYVVQQITEALSSFGQVVVDEMKVQSFSEIAHLITPILLRPIPSVPPSFSDLIQALHPTPALGAYPRAAGKRWLEEYQCHGDRNRFGAPAGCYFHDEKGRVSFSCYGAIRNVQWDADTMKLTAGCGVIRESICKDEWNEILLKLHTIKDLLAL